ncbi:YukJ family protein [Vallitalea sediminicola]
MSLQAYGLLKGKAVDTKEERDNNRPHYHILVKANEENYRISINIMSNDVLSELLFYTNENFDHPMTKVITKLPYGFYFSNDCSIDYIRGNMGFVREDMKKIPHDKVGPNNDLNEKLNHYIDKAISSDDTDIYIYGSKWKTGNYCKPDRIFGFSPSMGMHDIHMNQGNIRKWKKDSGVWQDGCLMIHYKEINKWVGIFLAFQSQSWDNNDCTGQANYKYKKKKR